MPTFRIIVTEHTEGPKTGNFVEKLGTYNPKTKERNLNGERIKYWLSVGAKASGTMHNMLVTAGIIEGKKVNVLPKKSPPKKEEPADSKGSTGSSQAGEVAPVAEAPIEEIPAPELKDDVKAAAETVAAETQN